MSKITAKDIIEAIIYMKAFEAKPCVRCKTLTIFGVCQLCQDEIVDEFCETLMDDFLWSKWFRGYVK